MQVKHRIDKACQQHGNLPNHYTIDAFKHGFVNKFAFILKIKAGLNEILTQKGGSKTRKTRAIIINAAHPFAGKRHGMRITHATAREPPHPPLAAIRRDNKPVFTPDDIDDVCGKKLGCMFEGEQGGYGRRLGGAPAFCSKYPDLCHPKNNSKPPTHWASAPPHHQINVVDSAIFSRHLPPIIADLTQCIVRMARGPLQDHRS